MSLYLVLFHVQDPAGAPIAGATAVAVSTAGAWSSTTNPCGDVIDPGSGIAGVMLSPGDYVVTFSAPGYVARQLPVHIEAEGPPIRVGLERGVPVWPPNRRDWRGAFIIPDLFPSTGWPQNIFGGDGKRLWTPAYGCYPDAGLRREMRQEFRAVRGYRFWPYDCAGWIYHTDYGFLDDDPARVRRDLIELLTDDIIPVVSACNDADGGSVVPFASFTANVDLIPIAFPMWEMNGPLGVADRQPDGSYAGRIIDAIRNTRAAAAIADLYLHFTAGHGAPGFPDERESWRYVRDQFGVLGLLSQDEGYERDPATGDPAGTGAGLQDTAERLATLDLLNVRFEQCTYAVYNKATVAKWAGWNEAQQVRYGNQLAPLAPLTAGFGDGGTAR